ncbi:MAG: ABC transporter ATP-binding protein [Peptococcaceae bacterium]
MAILEAIDVTKHYGTAPIITRALDGVNLTVEDGEFLAIVGASGSGKSTLLHLMGGLDVPTSGTVKVRGQDLSKMDRNALTIFRRREIGFVFQSYNLLPMMNVHDNIVLPVELDGGHVDEAYFNEIIEMLGLSEKLLALPTVLSGGQQQRVAIARALMTRPAIVLADEPTGNLDSQNSAVVMGLLQRSSRAFGQTLVMITHNAEIAQLADRIVRLEDGHIVEGGGGAHALAF